MSFFGVSKLLEKIYDVMPSAIKPSLIKGQKQRWRDDFNGTALSSNWEVTQTGNGQNLSVASSEITIATGTAISSTTIRNKKVFSIPCKVAFTFKISQRIVNQQFYFEVTDASGNSYARFLLDGTTIGTASIQTANEGSILTTDTISLGINSSVYGIAEIEANIDEIRFATKAPNRDYNGRLQSLFRHQKIPDPNLEYFVQIKAVNTAIVPSNTNLTIDSITVQENEIFTSEIVSTRGNKASSEALPVFFPSTPNVFIASTIAVFGNNTYLTESSGNLPANGFIIGSARDAINKTTVVVTCQVEQAGTLWVDQSPDGTTWLDYGPRDCTIGINTFTIQLNLRYFRVRYTNGNTAQTIFRLYSYARSI